MLVDLRIRITVDGHVVVLTRSEAIVLRDWLIREFPPCVDKPAKPTASPTRR